MIFLDFKGFQGFFLLQNRTVQNAQKRTEIHKNTSFLSRDLSRESAVQQGLFYYANKTAIKFVFFKGETMLSQIPLRRLLQVQARTNKNWFGSPPTTIVKRQTAVRQRKTREAM